MFKKIDERVEAVCAFLNRGWVIGVSGAALAASLAMRIKGVEAAADPAWGAIALSGFSMAYHAVKRLVKQRQIKAGLLITVAMAASIAIGETFAAGEVAFIMALGGALEDLTVAKAGEGVKSLIALKELVNAGIRVGDVVAVKQGQAFPCDGEVVEGETTVDQSIMTGESEPVRKGVGDGVLTGTLNRFGEVKIRATAVGKDSSLEKMIRLVKEAEKHQAPMQRVADRWASVLVPGAIGVAALTFLGCWAMGVEGGLTRAVTVLVTFCPCALALATPTSVVAGIGQAAKRGVLIKSGEALERMGGVEIVAFDKTGTITKGTWGNSVKRGEDGRILEGGDLGGGDELRENAPGAVAELKGMGVEVWLLTGDGEAAARRFGEACGIGNVRAGLLPQGKADAVKELAKRGAVAMVGDGVNDAAAMKYAAVGIAMAGAGTDIAAEASDIAIMNDNLSSVGYVRRMARGCLNTIRFNIGLSMVINFLAVGMGVAGVLNPVLGALVHNAGSLLVVMNAAMFYRRRF